MSISTTGIIFADLFVNSEDIFIEYFTQYYSENKTEIDSVINELSLCLESITSKKLTIESSERFHKAWKQFERVVLRNGNDLQLIVGYRDTGGKGKNVEFSTIIPQDSATIKNVIDTGSEAVRTAINLAKQKERAEKIEAILKDHLNNYIDELYYHRLGYSETVQLIDTNFDYIPQKWRKKYHLTDILPGKNWQEIYYSNYYSGQGLGQAYDAFMNHVANHHREVYSYLSKNGMSGDGFSVSQLKDVYLEEGELSGNFPKLLNDSLNTIGWYTGGDIVIVDPETMTVIYNIQLKTTQDTHVVDDVEKLPAKFKIAVANLKKIINGSYDKKGNEITSPFSKLSPQEKAKRLFEELQTSISNYSEFDSAIDNTIENIYKDSLPKKLDIILKSG